MDLQLSATTVMELDHLLAAVAASPAADEDDRLEIGTGAQLGLQYRQAFR